MTAINQIANGGSSALFILRQHSAARHVVDRAVHRDDGKALGQKFPKIGMTAFRRRYDEPIHSTLNQTDGGDSFPLDALAAVGENDGIAPSGGLRFHRAC